jgi:DNA-binding CsgD family transcriptional regulator
MAESTEVQFLGAYGWQRAELERRDGEIDTARAVVDETLDRIEFCSDDMARIAAVAATGVRVEGDAAQLARDRQDGEAERAALRRANAMLERVRLAAQSGGPVERAELAGAEAEHARARGEAISGASPRAGRPGPADSAPWAAAADAWLKLGRPYPATYARLRETEVLAAAGDRTAAAEVATGALQEARRLSSAWLVEELESLAARARLRLEGESVPASGDGAEAELPFGLTARELQVLALVAGGATNREIGNELHMAEKTASVHVSRILAKLDVRSRTEAAAVAHRHGLAGQPASV